MKAETEQAILARLRGEVARPWRNHYELYLPATDGEKAAALDSAVEF